MAGLQKTKAIPKSRAKTAYGLLNEVKKLILRSRKGITRAATFAALAV